MKNLYIISLAFFILILNLRYVNAQSQQQVLLKTCIDSAIANYPLIRQQSLFASQYQIQQQQVNNSNLPQIQFNAKATYQNEVISLNLNIPGMDIPQLSKDQYKFSLDIHQNIYKGGATNKKKNIYANQKEMAQQQLDVQLYSLKKTVVELFFGIMFNYQQINILNSYETQIDSQIEEFATMVDNGAMLKSKLNAFVLEKLKIQQKLVEAKSDRINLINNLSELTTLKLDTSTIFITTNISAKPNISQQRPEYKLMILQQRQLDLSKELVGVKYQPNIFAYGTAGYGRPGFNYLSDNFDDFYLIGVGVSWNIWNWQEGKKEKQILDLNTQIIEAQKETFENNLKLGLNTYNSEILKQQQLIKKDEQIIVLQKQIAKTSEAQLINGAITVTQYVDELQKVQQQELEYQIHKLKLKLAKVNYLWALGLL